MEAECNLWSLRLFICTTHTMVSTEKFRERLLFWVLSYAIRGFMISGVSHINLSVQDLETSFHFYTRVLDLKPLAKWKEGAYLLAGDLWFCLNLDPKTRVGPLPEYTHIAFCVSSQDFHSVSTAIVRSGSVIWKRNSSPGYSFYFLDPDGHKLELHVSDWKTRVQVAKEENWESMEFYV